MFLRTFKFSGRIGANVEELRAVSNWVLGTNHISKRYAGHSQYANRKSAKEASAQRRGDMIRKYRYEISKEIKKSKNANLSTNTKLRSIFGEAMKNNVPKATLENFIRGGEAELQGNCIHPFIYNNPIGIVSVVEISSVYPEEAKCHATNITRKFGFQLLNNKEIQIKLVGIITCKLLENVKNALDKAVEDAITANCEEVKEADGNCIEFQCDPSYINSCVKSLTDLGYEVENSETKYMFPELVQIEDEVIFEKLDKMEEKLQTLGGFVRISYNIE